MSILSSALALERNTEDELPMTLQVGLVGRDGIVLISDSFIYTEPPQQFTRNRPDVVRAEETIQKIKVSPSGTIAVSCPGDMPQAPAFAGAINRSFAETDTPIDDQLHRIASAQMKESNSKGAECLIVINKPEPTLLLLQCIKGRDGEEAECHCNHVPFYAFAGDRFNSSAFWIHRYYDIPSSRPTTDALLRLGSQVVVDASVLSSGSIRGIEAIRCNPSGIYRIPDDHLSLLVDAAQKRSERIKRDLFK